MYSDIQEKHRKALEQLQEVVTNKLDREKQFEPDTTREQIEMWTAMNILSDAQHYLEGIEELDVLNEKINHAKMVIMEAHDRISPRLQRYRKKQEEKAGAQALRPWAAMDSVDGRTAGTICTVLARDVFEAEQEVEHQLKGRPGGRDVYYRKWDNAGRPMRSMDR